MSSWNGQILINAVDKCSLSCGHSTNFYLYLPKTLFKDDKSVKQKPEAFVTKNLSLPLKGYFSAFIQY